jgi:hypothetical protein
VVGFCPSQIACFAQNLPGGPMFHLDITVLAKRIAFIILHCKLSPALRLCGTGTFAARTDLTLFLYDPASYFAFTNIGAK